MANPADDRLRVKEKTRARESTKQARISPMRVECVGIFAAFGADGRYDHRILFGSYKSRNRRYERPAGRLRFRSPLKPA
jgi:hypothetical protein